MTRVGYYRLPPVKGVFFSPAQEERLLLMGCQEVFSDRCLANAILRPGLDKAIAALAEGGTLVVLTLHALAGTTVDVMEAALKLKALGVNLIVAQPEIDTAANPAFFAACEALATFNAERPMVRAAETALVAKGVGMRSLTRPSTDHPRESGDPS